MHLNMILRVVDPPTLARICNECRNNLTCINTPATARILSCGGKLLRPATPCSRASYFLMRIAIEYQSLNKMLAIKTQINYKAKTVYLT